jgi:hypothetical protein
MARVHADHVARLDRGSICVEQALELCASFVVQVHVCRVEVQIAQHHHAPVFGGVGRPASGRAGVGAMSWCGEERTLDEAEAKRGTVTAHFPCMCSKALEKLSSNMCTRNTPKDAFCGALTFEASAPHRWSSRGESAHASEGLRQRFPPSTAVEGTWPRSRQAPPFSPLTGAFAEA